MISAFHDFTNKQKKNSQFGEGAVDLKSAMIVRLARRVFTCGSLLATRSSYLSPFYLPVPQLLNSGLLTVSHFRLSLTESRSLWTTEELFVALLGACCHKRKGHRGSGKKWRLWLHLPLPGICSHSRNLIIWSSVPQSFLRLWLLWDSRSWTSGGNMDDSSVLAELLQCWSNFATFFFFLPWRIVETSVPQMLQLG